MATSNGWPVSSVPLLNEFGTTPERMLAALKEMGIRTP